MRRHNTIVLQLEGNSINFASMEGQSLQEKYAPKSICFGCGPMNEKGLRIRSMIEDNRVVCDWKPDLHHCAFPNILNGGIIGTLLDCHSNWTAAWHLAQKHDWEAPRCTVTANYSIALMRPTPGDQTIHLTSKVVESGEYKAVVEAVLASNGEECAKCRGTFVVVKPGHPAYHRW